MRAYLLNAPWWKLSIVHGLSFAGPVTVLRLLYGDDGWTWTLVFGFLSGAVYGAVMGPASSRKDEPLRAVLGSMPPRSQRAALRAVLRGPVPDDQQIREAAHRVALHDLAGMGRLRGFALLVSAALGIVGVIFALTGVAWAWLAVAFAAVVVAIQVWLPRHLQHRADLLGAEPRPPAA